LKQTAATDPLLAGKCAKSEASSHSTALVLVASPETPVMLRCAAVDADGDAGAALLRVAVHAQGDGDVRVVGEEHFPHGHRL
jgi:hypothetical protein